MLLSMIPGKYFNLRLPFDCDIMLCPGQLQGVDKVDGRKWLKGRKIAISIFSN
jgi:hypothetical protein